LPRSRRGGRRGGGTVETLDSPSIWDETKRQSNFADHGLDFGDLDFGFFAHASVRRTHSDRLIAFGEFRGETIVAVVFKPPSPVERRAFFERPIGSEAISLISIRPASRA
jgi:uncharacterized DUF497 family protein